MVTDYLGTPTEMYDEAGALAWQAQLDIYGVARASVGAKGDCPFRWPGQYEDEETGLYWNRFRYYDPERGGYLSKDPIGLRGGLEPYGYVWDPLGETDVFGLSCSSDAAELRENMNKAGINEPPYPNAAHHVVHVQSLRYGGCKGAPRKAQNRGQRRGKRGLSPHRNHNGQGLCAYRLSTFPHTHGHLQNRSVESGPRYENQGTGYPGSRRIRVHVARWESSRWQPRLIV